MGVTLRFALYVFVIMTCAASVVMAQTPEPPQDQARNTLNQGVSAFRNGNYDVAIEYFKRAVELDPDFVDGQLYLATAYAQRYRPGGTQPPENDAFATNAIDWFKRVLARDPGNIAAYLGIASIYQNSQKFENAREAYLH